MHPMQRMLCAAAVAALTMGLNTLGAAAQSTAPDVPRGEEMQEMKEQFANPPRKYRMLQIVHHPGDPELADRLQRNGYAGIVTNVGFDNYLEDDAQWQALRERIAAFRERGMELWLYDEKGYPSGKAGGLTLRDHPEFETIGVLCARTEGSGPIRHAMPADERVVGGPLRVCAAPVNAGRYDLDRAVDLTAEATAAYPEPFAWTPPDGEVWGVLSFHVRRMFEGTHIVCNYSDALPYINIIDREAVARFIEVTHEAYLRECPEPIGDDIRAVFTDEPSLMTAYLQDDEGLLPALPWSRDFREAFQAARGYDVVDALPHLFEDCGDATPYRRLDYWAFVSKLVEENFYGQIQDWCRAHGMGATGHALLEESLYWHGPFEGDLYRDLRRMDIPGIDMLNSNPTALARSRQIPIPKFVSSVTHMIGGWECMSETSSHVQHMRKLPCSFEQRLGTINYQYVLGLTRITSYYGYDEFSDAERPVFNDHIGRLGYMLTRGTHVADVGVYYPIQTAWALSVPTSRTAYAPIEPARTEPADQTPRMQRVSDAFGATSIELLANQRDFDYLDDQAITDATINAAGLHIHGETFRCLVLPETWVIPAATYERIEQFVAQGGALVIVGALPEKGMSPEETAKVTAISERLRGSDRIAVAPTVEAVPGSVGAFLPPDVAFDAPARETFYCHRYAENADIYFLANLLEEPFDRAVTFQATGEIERMHPTTGETRPEAGTTQGEYTTVHVQLAPLEGVFYVFQRP